MRPASRHGHLRHAARAHPDDASRNEITNGFHWPTFSIHKLAGETLITDDDRLFEGPGCNAPLRA
jgi:hypothetical protein